MHAHRCHNDPSASTAGHSHSPIVAIEVTAVNVTCSTARALSPGSSQQQCFRGQETGRAGQWGSGLPREASPPLPPPPQGPPAHRGVEHRQAQQECLQWHTHTRTHRQQARGVGPAGRNACMCGAHTQAASQGGRAGRAEGAPCQRTGQWRRCHRLPRGGRAPVRRRRCHHHPGLASAHHQALANLQP